MIDSARRIMIGLTHNETRFWHGWHRHLSLVMLSYAIMAAVQSQADAGRRKSITASG